MQDHAEPMEPGKHQTTEQLIFFKLAEIKVQLELMNKNIMRVVYALLGIVAGTLGLKLVGSPWWVDVFAYSAFFTATVLFVSTVFEWKEIPLANKIFRIAFFLFITFSSACRLFMWNYGEEAAPLWFSPVIDSFLVVLCIIILIPALKVKNIFPSKAKHIVLTGKKG